MFIPTGSSLPLPAIIVELPTDDPAEGLAELSAATSLTSLGEAGAIPGRADGWMVFVCPGADWIDVIVRAPGWPPVFSGPSLLPKEWLESVTQRKHCLLLVGRAGLDAALDAHDPAETARLAKLAIDSHLLMGGLVPVYTPVPKFERPGKWPGTVDYEGSPAKDPLGFSVRITETAGFSEAVNVVRSGAAGKTYKWVRQRLSVELLRRGERNLPVVVSLVAEQVTQTGIHGSTPRRRRAFQAGLISNWLVIRTITAFVLHRTLPHWHILGIHAASFRGPMTWLDASIDPWAEELLAMGDSDDIVVWLDMPQASSNEDHAGDVVVFRGDYRLGVCPDIHDAYRAILMEPGHSGTNLAVEATRSRMPDGSWSLKIPYPLAP